MSTENRLNVYASRQYGVFSLAQARQAGLSDDMIYRRVQSGAWVRLAPKVFALTSAPPKWERQVAAAILSRPRALVSGPAAAYLHGFNGFGPGRPEITVPTGSAIRSPIARVVASEWFDQIGTVPKAGFQIANVPETLLALSARLPTERLEPLLDDCLAAKTADVDDFEGIRRRVSGARVRGATRLFPLLDARAVDAWEPPGNQLERYLDRLVDHPEVPPSVSQHPFHFGDRGMVVDRYIPLWWLILEADGRRWHTRRADFERDRARDNAASAAGLTVLRFTWKMLTDDFEGCRSVLLQTGAARSHPA